MLLTQKGPEFPLVFCWADSRIWHMPRQPVKDNQDVVQICKQWVCCAFPSTQSWTHRRKQRRRTTEKGWNKKAKKKKKDRWGKKREKNEPWNSFCYCLVAMSDPSIATQWTVASQVFLSMGFCRQEYWSWLHFFFQWIFLDEIQPASTALAGKFFTTALPGKPDPWKEKKEISTNSSWTITGATLSSQWVSQLSWEELHVDKRTLSSAPPGAHQGHIS